MLGSVFQLLFSSQNQWDLGAFLMREHFGSGSGLDYFFSEHERHHQNDTSRGDQRLTAVMIGALGRSLQNIDPQRQAPVIDKAAQRLKIDQVLLLQLIKQVQDNAKVRETTP